MPYTKSHTKPHTTPPKLKRKKRESLLVRLLKADIKELTDKYIDDLDAIIAKYEKGDLGGVKRKLFK